MCCSSSLGRSELYKDKGLAQLYLQNLSPAVWRSGERLITGVRPVFMQLALH